MNEDQDLFEEQIEIFRKRYPKVYRLIKNFLIWDERKRKTFSEEYAPKSTGTTKDSESCPSLLKKRKRRRTMDKNQCFRFISELKEIQVKVMENQ